jgi:multiple sugar transport system ATP-binding protein
MTAAVHAVGAPAPQAIDVISVYLMDEPLSNLDAKLRVQTRTELAELQARLAVTTVYVTHDQVEAMTMGHRVAVLKDGNLQQCDTPHTLYHEPSNVFVAGFIGSPAMNLLPAAIVDGEVTVGGHRLSVGPVSSASSVTLGFRPESVRVVEDGPVHGQIRVVEDLGAEVFVHVLIDHDGTSTSIVVKAAAPFAGRAGERVRMRIDGAVHVFAESGERLSSATASQ